LQPGSEVTLRGDIVVRPFPTVHTLPSQGYLVVSKKKQLKKEYAGAGRDAIIAAKKSGVEINDYIEACVYSPAGQAAAAPTKNAKLVIPELPRSKCLHAVVIPELPSRTCMHCSLPCCSSKHMSSKADQRQHDHEQQGRSTST
jgi:hypothetical protein